MKGLFRFLSPFSPDQSGAVSVLFELGGIIVILDAGGCTGNVCGFDEPRWFTKKSAIYSAGLRDIDAILGRDDKLMEKLKDAADTVDADFIALVGTPVPSVIATDYEAVCRLVESKYGIPAIYVDTTGMEDYDRGQKRAYEQILRLLKRCRKDASRGADTPAAALGRRLEERGSRRCGIRFAGVWGATPLDLPALDSAEALRSRIEARYPDLKAVTYGMDSSLDALYVAQKAERNFVVSWSGLKPAEALEKLGLPMDVDFFLPDADEQTDGRGKRILIVHQQVQGNAMRDWIRGRYLNVDVDVASFFQMDEKSMEGNDVQMDSEGAWIKLVKERDYDIIIGDPIFKRAISFWKGAFASAPQYAVSGGMFAPETDEEYWSLLKNSLDEAVND